MRVQIKKKLFALFIAFLFIGHNLSFAIDPIQKANKYPDYASEFLGKDKYEKLNRKIFAFNATLNKYAIRPVHILWASILPKRGIDMLQNAYTNIEYPKRLASTLIQKDFSAAKNETLRFLTNSTLGLGGLFDPAKKYFELEPLNEDMGQALAKLNVKQGPYLVVPVLQSSTPRDLAGKILEIPLDPTIYTGSPIAAAVKLGLLINRTSYMQPLSKMLEATYADPYDVTKKFYGIESYIKTKNFDRQNEKETDTTEKVKSNPETVLESDIQDVVLEPNAKETIFKPDIVLENYNPQSPVVDSMRTALFELPGIYDSMWTEISIWNRSFANRIKTSSVSLYPGREDYKYRYILQKEKTAPIAIIYPSVGEGITTHHGVVLAKLFWDEGYSVVIQASSLNWESAKSMPLNYKPGMPSQDADYLRLATSKILDSLKSKYDCEPNEKIILGTSLGAMSTLFVADKESKNNSLNISKYIAINPPIELLFAIDQIDKNAEEWNKNSVEQKEKTAVAAARTIQLAQAKTHNKIETLPFSQGEAKLITSFIMRQKLSDLIFTIENASQIKTSDIYDTINNISYFDYMEKYLLQGQGTIEDLNFATSLHSIADFLKSNNSYKIYHTPDDYLVNAQQLKQLKEYTGNKTSFVSNGSHLGFLYRQEFIDELKKEISHKDKMVQEPDKSEVAEETDKSEVVQEPKL